MVKKQEIVGTPYFLVGEGIKEGGEGGEGGSEDFERRRRLEILKN